MGSIYLIRNTINQKCYIGQTTRDAIEKRIPEHINRRDKNSLISQAIAKYGKDVFTFEILHDGILDFMLDDLEKDEIKKHNAFAPHGYNLTTGGNSGRKASAETCQKMSNAMKGRRSWNKGKKLSIEHRQKLSKAKKGTKLSLETRQKMSKAHKGNTYRKGTKHSLETRRKMSKAKIGNRNAAKKIKD